MKKPICLKEEDLICKNCIFSELSEDPGYSLCNIKHEDMGELVRAESYCGEGSFKVKAIIEDYTYDHELKERKYEPSKEKIKTLTRDWAIQTFENDGLYEF